MEKVLILGSSGFLGAKVLKLISAKEYSIDAVDLIIELKAFTGLVIDPDDFKSVKTVEDVINIVCKLLENETNSEG